MNCKIIRDLLPLYCDNICSRESRRAVEEHLAGCPDCMGVYEKMRQESAVPAFPTDGKEEARVLKTIRKTFSRQKVRAIMAAIFATVLMIATLTAFSDLERPIPYQEGLVTAKLAEDTAIDLYFYGGDYAAFYGFHRVVDGENAVYFCLTKNLRTVLPPTKEGHLVIGNGLFTDFETGYFRVPRTVDAIYYLTGDYDALPDMGDQEFLDAAKDAVLIWARG